MDYKYLAKPCRNFNILGAASFTDPLDGVEKVAVTSFAHGHKGIMIIFDPLSEGGETYEFPEDWGAWAVYNHKNECILLGTSSQYGYLHRFDLRSRKWTGSLRSETEEYIWDFTLGSDGRIYAGTYHGCKLLRYDPETHVLDDLGKITKREGMLYSRLVYGRMPGYIVVYTGMQVEEILVYHIATGEIEAIGELGDGVAEVNERFICLRSPDGQYKFFDKDLKRFDGGADMLEKRDPRLDEDMWKICKFSGGRVFAIRGQEYCFADGDGRFLKTIPTLPPPGAILGLTPGPDGRIWGSSGMGMTIFNYDPRTGEYWNSRTVAKTTGQVYGVLFADNGKLYMTSYSGGEHIVYDTTKPWEDWENPKTLRTLGPEYIRPTFRFVKGPGGCLYSGWMAEYGVRGGAITRINPVTDAVELFREPVPGYAVEGLAADSRYLYITTNGEANGLETLKEQFHLCKLDPEGKVVVKKMLPDLHGRSWCALAGGILAVGMNRYVFVYNTDTLEIIRQIETGEVRSMYEWDENRVLVMTAENAKYVNVFDGSLETISDLPKNALPACVKDGTIYFSCLDSNLYCI